MATRDHPILEVQDKLDALTRQGSRETDSHMMRSYLRELEAHFANGTDPQRTRDRMDRALGERSLSSLLRAIRDEETH